MRILIDINHPAHVHYFRNFSKIMENMGHETLFVSREKEITHNLLDLYNIPFISRGKGKNGKIGKFLYLIYADWKLIQIAKKWKPDLFFNFLHPYPSQVAKFLGKPSLVFSDTEHASLHQKLTVPYATQIFTPDCYRIEHGKKHVRFNSYMELSYLHPNYFSPDPNILELLNIKEGEKYVLMRFVSWAATHDFGHQGMSLENKRKAVKSLEPYAKVLITSEGPLPPDLEKYRIKIPFDKMHDALYFSSLLFGESATMASEAAVMGTPSVFMDNDGRGYTDDQEKQYGLVHNFSESEEDQQKAIEKAVNILSQNDSRAYENARQRLLNNCIDTTQFMVEQALKYHKTSTSQIPV